MRTSAIAAISLTSLLATAPIAVAQQSPSARTPSTAATAVSDADLETFATIYVDLLATVAKLEAEMKSAQTEQEALAVRERAQTESIAKVEQRGWTTDKFNSVSEAINRDPALTDKAVKLIEDK